QPVPAQRLYACAQVRRIKAHIGLPRVVRCERPTSLTADADRWHARPMGFHATLSCWRRDAYRGGRSRSRRLSRMPLRTVAAPLTGGAQVTAWCVRLVVCQVVWTAPDEGILRASAERPLMANERPYLTPAG